MKNYLLILRLAAAGLLSCLLVAAAPVSADTAGTIEGQIINATPDGTSVPADQQLTLLTYQNGTELGPVTTSADAQGNYSFGGLATTTDYTYVIEATFQGTIYVSAYQNFAGQTDINCPMDVYDTTTSSEGISVTEAHTVVSFQSGTLEVMNYLQFANPAQLAFIGDGSVNYAGQNATVLLPLPAGASNLMLDANLVDNSLVSDQGLMYFGPIVPGSPAISYSYSLDAAHLSSYQLSWSVSLPTDAYEFLVPGQDIKVSSPDLAAGGLVSLQGTNYQYFSTQSVPASQTINLTLSLPANATLTIVLWGLTGLIVLGLAALFVVRRRAPVRVAVADDEEILLRRIARLDDAFENGTISKQQYQQQRRQELATLVKLKQQKAGARFGSD